MAKLITPSCSPTEAAVTKTKDELGKERECVCVSVCFVCEAALHWSKAEIRGQSGSVFLWTRGNQKKKKKKKKEGGGSQHPFSTLTDPIKYLYSHSAGATETQLD